MGAARTVINHSEISWKQLPLSEFSEALEVTVECAGRKVRILDVHFLTGDPQGRLKGKGTALPQRVPLSAETRRAQARALQGESPLPALLVGDFNSPPTSLAYAMLAKHWTDSFATSGNGFGLTYSSGRPVLRIDYLWCQQLRPVETRVLDCALSDHRPVLGRFAFISASR